MSRHHTSGPCHRCGRGGHLARECSLHVCFRCNGRGHMAWECVEGVTCNRCGERGHLQRNCKNVSCHKCGRKGHISKFCNDPFIKAEEVERNERHKALVKSRVSNNQGSGKGGLPSLTISGSTGSQMVPPGPWDGLGNLVQDRNLLETQASGVRVGKPNPSRSQSGMLINVKVLTVKRKIDPGANMECAKRRPHENYGNLDIDTGRNPIETSPCKDTSKIDEPPQWNFLLGYGSDDSRDECHRSNGGQSGELNCHLEENVQSKFRTTVDEIDGSATGLQSSVVKEPTVIDETNGSATSLQSSLEQEPTGIDERNGSASGLQSSVEQEPSGLDEKNGSAIRDQSGGEQESMMGSLPTLLFQVHEKDASREAHVSDSFV